MKLTRQELRFPKYDGHVHCRSPGKQDYKDNMRHVLDVAYRTGHAGAGLMVWNLDPPANTIEVVEACKREMHSIMEDIPIVPVLHVAAPDDLTDFERFVEFCNKDDDVATMCTDISGTEGSRERSMEYIHELFEKASKYEWTKGIKVHCEAPRYFQDRENWNERRNPASAQMAVHEVLQAAHEHQVAWWLYMPHLSTVGELLMVRKAKEELDIYAEVTHQGVLVPDVQSGVTGLLQQNPPLRFSVEQEALKQAETEGLTDGRASDHAPHTDKDKEKGMSGNPTMAGSPRAHVELVGRVGQERAQALLFDNFVVKLHDSAKERIQSNADDLLQNDFRVEDCTGEYWYDPFKDVLQPLDEILD